MSLSYLPHFVLIGLGVAGSLIFIQKGDERRDLLMMGFASLCATAWMLSVVMVDLGTHAGELPNTWLWIGSLLQVPAVLFVLLSVLYLEHYYLPDHPVTTRAWLPALLSALTLVSIGLIYPPFFLANPEVVELSHAFTLRFTPGPGYYLFLILASFATYQGMKRAPRIVDLMRLPEAERRTRMLFTLATLTVVWSVIFEIVPTLAGRTAPSFLRMVGVGLALVGSVYALALSRTLDPRAIFRGIAFFGLRIVLLTLPVAAAAIYYRPSIITAAESGLVAASLVLVVLLDVLGTWVRHMAKQVDSRARFSTVQRVNQFVDKLLILRDLPNFTQVVTTALSQALGNSGIRLFLVQDGALRDPQSEKPRDLPAGVRKALLRRGSATTYTDFQVDPRLLSAHEELLAFFDAHNAEVILPLCDEDELSGIIILEGKESLADYFDHDLQFLDDVRTPLALALSNTLNFELSKTGKPLSVLPNREFLLLLEQQVRRTKRYAEPLSVALYRIQDAQAMDVVHGEGVAAQILSDVATRLLPSLRAFDIPGFYDAHTLALILPQTALEGAHIAAERQNKALEAQALSLEGPAGAISFAFAVATVTPLVNDHKELLAEAEGGFVHSQTAEA